MFNELPYRKAQKIWREFPYLWGILKDWNPRYEIRIQRLDDDALEQAVRPCSNRVFLHLTRIGEPFRAFEGKKLQDWWETLEEVPVEEPRALANLLFESKAVRLCAQQGGGGIVINAVVFSDIIRVSGVNTPSRHDADIITIYKSPRAHSIYNLVIEKWKSLQVQAHVGLRT